MNADNPEQFDLIVIGAGINGAGIARDAALRGLRVLLVDKGDIGGGTTSWSSRLIHGGLRYLEHREFGLVRESLQERERLLGIAPHLVQPLPLLIPIYKGDSRGPLLIRAGMLAYDILSVGKSLPRHRMLSPQEAVRRDAGIAETDLKGAALYYDGQVEFPERLALENALDARAHGADVRTYHQVDRIMRDGDRVRGIEGQDVISGESLQALAPVIFNVAGPWVDRVLAEAGAHAPSLIGGTKGTHIVVQPFAGAPRDAIYVEAQSDGRPFFIIPWNDLYLIGTTDTRFTGDLDRVEATEEEIDWLLTETNRVIPGGSLRREDVCYSYAGVRPLPATSDGSEGAITRRHLVVAHGERGGPLGLYSVVGGKLTTYRELAEQAVDIAMGALQRPRVPSRTGNAPLPGAETPGSWQSFRQGFLRESGLGVKSAEHLLRVYGTRAAQVLARADSPALREVVDPWTGAIAAEAPWSLETEGARTLSDILARRTTIGLGPDVGIGPDRALANILQTTSGWSAERATDEVESYRKWVGRYRPRALTAESAGARSGAAPSVRALNEN